MCVHGPVCVCVCVCVFEVCVRCRGYQIKQLAAHFLFQVSVYQWSRPVLDT